MMTPNDYAPPAHVQQELEEARRLLKACSDFNEAIDKLDADLVRAREKLDDVQGRRADLMAERALEGDPTKIKAIGPRLDKLSTEASNAKTDVEAIEYAQKAVKAKLLGAEEALQAFAPGLPSQLLVSAHGQHVADLLLEELIAGVRVLLPTILKAEALWIATGSTTLLDLLTNIKIPGELPGVDLFGMGWVNLPGQRGKFAELWRDDPELLELNRTASETRRVLQQVQGYTPRAQRLKAAVPYVRKGITVDLTPGGGNAAHRMRELDSAPDAAAAATNASASKQAHADAGDTPQKAARAGGRRPAVQPQEINMGAVNLNADPFAY